MKRIKYLGSVALVLILLLLTLLLPKSVYADTSPQESGTQGEVQTPIPPDASTRGIKISVTDQMTSALLYRSLLDVYNKYYGLGGDSGKAIETTLYQNMFAGMDFSAMDGVLDLSGKGNSKNGISELTGLELVNFSDCINLTAVDLSGNSLTIIQAANLSSLDNITRLDISDNDITSANLSELENLEVLDASDNQLTTLDLSFLKAEKTDAIINLSGNKITDVNDVYLRRAEMLNNDINLYVANTLTNAVYEGNAKVNVQAGLVGVKSGKYSKSDRLIYSKIDNLINIGINATDVKVVVKDYNNTAVKYSVLNSAVNDSVDILQSLQYGKYILFFADANDSSISAQSQSFVDQYSAITIDLVPDAPSISVTKDGEKIDFASGDKLTSDVSVTLSSSDPNATIMYKVDDGEWVSGTSLDIKAETGARVQVKSIVDGLESDVAKYYFAVDNSFDFGDMLSIVLIIIAFLALMFGLLPLVRYFINKPIKIQSEKKNKDVD